MKMFCVFLNIVIVVVVIFSIATVDVLLACV